MCRSLSLLVTLPVLELVAVVINFIKHVYFSKKWSTLVAWSSRLSVVFRSASAPPPLPTDLLHRSNGTRPRLRGGISVLIASSYGTSIRLRKVQVSLESQLKELKVESIEKHRMDLNEMLKIEFITWKPPAPVVKGRSKGSITLDWQLFEPFAFLGENLIYTVERREKMPRWVVVYSGGRSAATVDNLAPRHPHKFRVQVIVKASAVDSLGVRAVRHYGSREAVVQKLKEIARNVTDGVVADEEPTGDCQKYMNEYRAPRAVQVSAGGRWLRSRWSDETWTSTDTDGTSALCFCMAVRCGYLGQLQAMLEERPELVNIPSPGGLTPLATAVRKGELNVVRFLVQAGAEVNRALAGGRTPLHLAVLEARAPLVELLLDSGADLQLMVFVCVPVTRRARDVNGMRAEHFAADCGDPRTLALLLRRGGELDVRDSNGWTPLFRAVCQGANTEVIEELVARGSRVDVVDRAGLALADAARILRDENGRRRGSVLRRVDAAFPREAALEHFTRLTKKISSVHSLLK